MNKILKLSSGEEIVCKMVDSEHHRSYEIVNPLRIHSVPKMTPEGIEEAISLQRWIHYSEEQNFLIDKNKVMVVTSASLGLSRFYDYCVEKMEKRFQDIGSEPTNEQLQEIEDEEAWEEYSVNSKLLH